MATLDLHSLKLESGGDFLDARSFDDDGSQYELYGLTNSALTSHQETGPNYYPVPFQAHAPYTQIGMAGSSSSSSGDSGRNLVSAGPDCLAEASHQRRGGKLLNGGASAKQRTAGRSYDRSPAEYNGRRSTSERRDRINERERDRMHMLCDAFERLRQVLPLRRPKRGPHRQKLSKISTLVFAQNYIRTLEDILRNPAEYADCRLTPPDPGTAAAGEAGRAGPSVPPSAPTAASEEDFGALLDQADFYHQQYAGDVFSDPLYATF